MKTLVKTAMMIVMTIAFIPSLNAVNTDAKDDCLFCAGRKLIYEVRSERGDYLFIVEVEKASASEVRFRWLMTNRVGMQGTITMTKEALKNGMKLYNYFGAGEDLTLVENRTSVWLSQKAFEQLKSGEATELDTGGGPALFMREDGPMFTIPAVSLDITDVGAVSAITAKSGDEQTIVFYDNPEFPVILEMKLDFTIRLLGIV